MGSARQLSFDGQVRYHEYRSSLSCSWCAEKDVQVRLSLSLLWVEYATPANAEDLPNVQLAATRHLVNPAHLELQLQQLPEARFLFFETVVDLQGHTC